MFGYGTYLWTKKPFAKLYEPFCGNDSRKFLFHAG